MSGQSAGESGSEQPSLYNSYCRNQSNISKKSDWHWSKCVQGCDLVVPAPCEEEVWPVPLGVVEEGPVTLGDYLYNEGEVRANPIRYSDSDSGPVFHFVRTIHQEDWSRDPSDPLHPAVLLRNNIRIRLASGERAPIEFERPQAAIDLFRDSEDEVEDEQEGSDSDSGSHLENEGDSDEDFQPGSVEGYESEEEEEELPLRDLGRVPFRRRVRRRLN